MTDLSSKLVALRKPNTEEITFDKKIIKWRPIAVQNLGPKLTELRLQPVLNNLVYFQSITSYQHGFIASFSTQKWICNASEARIQNAKSIVAIDFANAYNTLSWDMIGDMLENDEFHRGVGEGFSSDDYKQERKFMNA